MKTVATRLEKELNLRLSAVHLVDSHYCSDASKFISVCMTSLNAMLQMEMPHVNVLSKVDTIEKYGKLNFNIGTSKLSFYAQGSNFKNCISAQITLLRSWTSSTWSTLCQTIPSSRPSSRN